MLSATVWTVIQHQEITVSKNKKLVLNKSTVKNLKVQTEIKTGATAAGCSGGEVSKSCAINTAPPTQTCVFCTSVATFQGATNGC
jgi:hypothetical protein